MTAPRPAIVLIASLDTKGEEAAFLAERLRAEGDPVLVVDFGTGQPAHLRPDISAEAVASRSGAILETLRRDQNRNAAISAMTEGVEALIRELDAAGAVAGVIGFGGSGGTAVGTAAMRQLPLGTPKVMVSTVASSNVQPYVGIKDVCMIHSVADFVGLNPISEAVLGNAAAAMSGMVRARSRARDVGRTQPLVAASIFGVTTPAVDKCRHRLAAAGMTLVPFHATGIGGQTMESLIADGFFTAVLDLTTTEWADEVVGGTLSAGPDRLGAAARAGLPQVVAPGALDMVNFFGPDAFPARFAGRLIHRHNDNVVLMRTTAEESAEIGRRIAGKLNAATGPVVVVFPRRGVSALDAEGQAFFDPVADAALLRALQTGLEPQVRLRLVDAHINDDVFAQACCDELLAMVHPPLRMTSHA